MKYRLNWMRESGVLYGMPLAVEILDESGGLMAINL